MRSNLFKGRQLNLSFKGERDYLHGTDIYMAVGEAMVSLYSKKTWVSYIVFREFAQSACDLKIDDLENIQNDLVRARFTAQDGNRCVNGLIYETGETIEQRYSFDESRIIRNSSIKEQCIAQKERAGFSTIEEIVACTKHLHNFLMPQIRGRWIFSQLDLSAPFSEDKHALYSIRIRQNIANRMTVSDIEEDGRSIGKIRFTMAGL